MTRLEDLQPTAAIRGILPEQAVTVVSVQWFGSEALELTYKGPTGRVANEPRVQVVEHGRPWSFDGDGRSFRLVSEAHRIRLAHLFDPVLAVHTSLVEPLPHQRTAVYEAMLPVNRCASCSPMTPEPARRSWQDYSSRNWLAAGACNVALSSVLATWASRRRTSSTTGLADLEKLSLLSTAQSGSSSSSVAPKRLRALHAG